VEIAAYISKDRENPLVNYPDFGSREIDYIVQQEDVAHLDDFIFRRSMIGKLGRSTEEGLRELGSIIGRVKGWDEDRLQNEVERAIYILRSKHKMNFAQYQGIDF
jgi:glycerol-3-phosphate dehydrogenase